MFIHDNYPKYFPVKCTAAGMQSFFLSFFLAGRVFSPTLRPYMIGPMRSPDIQNLSEAFASLKREKSL